MEDSVPSKAVEGPPLAPPRSWWWWVATVLVAAAVAWTAWTDLAEKSYARQVIRGRNLQMATGMEGIDTLANALTNDPARGRCNAVVRFEAFTWSSDLEVQVGQIYYRLNYAASPRRVYVLPDDHPYSAKAVITEDFRPDKAWLKAHDVGTILHFHRFPDGQVVNYIERVTP
jgi:hypothetical protein